MNKTQLIALIHARLAAPEPTPGIAPETCSAEDLAAWLAGATDARAERMLGLMPDERAARVLGLMTDAQAARALSLMPDAQVRRVLGAVEK